MRWIQAVVAFAVTALLVGALQWAFGPFWLGPPVAVSLFAGLIVAALALRYRLPVIGFLVEAILDV